MKTQWPTKLLDITLLVVGLAMCSYHLIATQYIVFGPWMHQNAHLGFALLMVFLSAFKRPAAKKLWPWIFVLLALSLIATGYLHIFNLELEARRGIINRADIIIGIILVVVTFEGTRLIYGNILPIVGGIFIAYTFLGQYLPSPLWHFPLSLDAIISKYNMGFDGMFGMVLGLSANYIFLFVVFGSLLQMSGANRFFMELAKLVSRRLSSAAGMTAVVSSALVGCVTGISGVNVVITGQFTIPTMKNVGYEPEQAGAIESVASTGSSLVPPIMGMVAFVMAQYIGVPYVRICAMAIIPATLYYLCLALFTHLSALKHGIKSMPTEVDRRAIVVSAPPFLIPLAVIIILLVWGYSPMYAAFYAIVSLVAASLLRKETRGTWRGWVNAFVEAARMGASIAVIAGIIGVLISSIYLTGIGIKFPSMVSDLSAGNLMIALLLVAFAALLLGCAMPPFGAYIIVATIAAPALLKLGLPVAQAHWFIMLFSTFALITPPLGLSVVVASALANANYLKTCWEAVKASAICWFLPFMVIFVPVVILQSGKALHIQVVNLTASFCVVFVLQAVLVGYMLEPLGLAARGIMLISAAAMIAFIVTGTGILLAVGLVLGTLLVFGQIRRRRQAFKAACIEGYVQKA